MFDNTSIGLEGLYSACSYYNQEYDNAVKLARQIAVSSCFSMDQAVSLVTEALHLGIGVTMMTSSFNLHGLSGIVDIVSLKGAINGGVSLTTLSEKRHRVHDSKEKSNQRKRTRGGVDKRKKLRRTL